MGLYINPSNCSKEQWLRENARQVERQDAKVTDEEVPVILVRNPTFSAAAVCYDQRELNAFSAPGDRRPATWYMAARGKVREVCEIPAGGLV